MIEFKCEYSDRIDKLISDNIPYISRNAAQNSIRCGNVYVNGKLITKNSFVVKNGSTIRIKEILTFEKNVKLIPKKMNLDIVYEDDYLLLVNKCAGIVVHPAPGHYTDTLLNGLLYYLGKENLSDLSKDSLRTGIVHRLDKDTSGLLLIAKTNFIHNKLVEQIKCRQMKRNYLALVHGNNFSKNFIVERPIKRSIIDRKKMNVCFDGKYSKTTFKLIKLYRNYSLYKCELHTGRTHQIRVHLLSIPIYLVGDLYYHNRKNVFGLKGQFLHAYNLSFIHPVYLKKMNFEVPLPNRLSNILNQLEGI